MQTLSVALGERSYPIHVGGGLLDRADLIAPFLVHKKVAVVTNPTVAPLYLERVAGVLAGEGVEGGRSIGSGREEDEDMRPLDGIFDEVPAQRHAQHNAPLAPSGGGSAG